MTRQQAADGLPSWVEPGLATLTRERFSLSLIHISEPTRPY